MTSVELDILDETEFEEFCFDLLGEMGFVNLDWRKGTGLRASPADRGRDIVGYVEREDIDGAKILEKWFVDCKHYKRGVPPEKLQGLLAWAQAERPHTILFIASNFLSNAAKDFLEDFGRNNHPSFRIKYWERPTLERLVEGNDKLLGKYLIRGIRDENAIIAAEQEFFEKVWYDRHTMLSSRAEEGRIANPDIWARAEQAAGEVRTKYGADQLGPYDDFEWGMINGKLSALRWVLGDEWDMLDT